MARLRIGSRASQLALWQAHHISDLLRAQGHTVELEIIKTTGDKITDVALAKVGTKGMFTKEIEEALIDNRVALGAGPRLRNCRDYPPRRSTRRFLFCEIREHRSAAAAGERWYQQFATSGSVEGSSSGYSDPSSPRQCGYAPAQARIRRLRCR